VHGRSNLRENWCQCMYPHFLTYDFCNKSYWRSKYRKTNVVHPGIVKVETYNVLFCRNIRTSEGLFL
jgi:hypothetical protein